MIYTNTQDILIYIRQQMIAQNISVVELARRMNRAQSTVSMTFKQKNITLETLNDICKALGCNLVIKLEPMPLQ